MGERTENRKMYLWAIYSILEPNQRLAIVAAPDVGHARTKGARAIHGERQFTLARLIGGDVPKGFSRIVSRF